MKFWAIAYQYQEDVFFNFKLNEDIHAIDGSCFLPTKEMAERYIEDELGDDYVPVEIELESLQKNGIWSYNRGKVERWDEEY